MSLPTHGRIEIGELDGGIPVVVVADLPRGSQPEAKLLSANNKHRQVSVHSEDGVTRIGSPVRRAIKFLPDMLPNIDHFSAMSLGEDYGRTELLQEYIYRDFNRLSQVFTKRSHLLVRVAVGDDLSVAGRNAPIHISGTPGRVTVRDSGSVALDLRGDQAAEPIEMKNVELLNALLAGSRALDLQSVREIDLVSSGLSAIEYKINDAEHLNVMVGSEHLRISGAISQANIGVMWSGIVEIEDAIALNIYGSDQSVIEVTGNVEWLRDMHRGQLVLRGEVGNAWFIRSNIELAEARFRETVSMAAWVSNGHRSVPARLTAVEGSRPKIAILEPTAGQIQTVGAWDEIRANFDEVDYVQGLSAAKRDVDPIWTDIVQPRVDFEHDVIVGFYRAMDDQYKGSPVYQAELAAKSRDGGSLSDR